MNGSNFQYPGGGGNVGSGVPDYQQQQEENLRRSFSDIFLGGDEHHPPPPGPLLQQHHLPPNPYAMPPNYCEYMSMFIITILLCTISQSISGLSYAPHYLIGQFCYLMERLSNFSDI